MREHSFQTTFKIYETAEELPAAERRLLDVAKKSLENAYAPYSKFKVGAAVSLKNGEFVSGSNMENAAYPLCICAEQAALAAASNQYPGLAVEAIAVTVRNSGQIIDRPAAPCGGCRQVICEAEERHGEKIKVILMGETGAVYVFERAKDLLPLAFDQSFL